MAREVTLHLPEAVWTSLVEFEPFPGALALAPPVRQRLRGGRQMRQTQPTPGVVRVVVLTMEEAHTLEMWLTMIGGHPNAPRASVTALALLRDARVIE